MLGPPAKMLDANARRLRLRPPFEHLLLHVFAPPSMRRFAPRRPVPGPGLRHLALEYDLVEALRPTLVVDLGAGDASSFFAYCQSMVDHDVDGTCYAVDTWTTSPGTHPEATLDAIREHGRGHYPGISYFVNMQPCEARRHFDEETIDLLRIDGTRSDVIAGADVEAWYRRVRPGGLIAWHGAADEPSLWSLLAPRCRTALFTGGRGGLGLARKEGPPATADLLALLFERNEGPDLDRFYGHLHEHLEFGRVLAATLKRPPSGPG